MKQYLLSLVFLFLSVPLYSQSNTSLLIDAQASTYPVRDAVSMQAAYSEFAVDSSYVLGPGDFLDVYLEGRYVATIKVAPDGSLFVDAIGAEVVTGKTLAEVRRLFMTRAEQKYKPGYLALQLSVMRKFRFNVLGAVLKPGQYAADAQTRLSMAFRQIGELAPNAQDDSILLIRNGDTTVLNYYSSLRSGSFAGDPFLAMGDLIYVPYRKDMRKVTFVLEGGSRSVPYKEKASLQYYLEKSKFAETEDLGDYSVAVTDSSGKGTWYNKDDAAALVLAPGCSVELITRKLYVYVGGATSSFGKIIYNPSWKAVDYIAASGLNVITGAWHQATVLRNGENVDIDIVQDRIMPGDYIEMPRSYYESFKDFTMFTVSVLTVISTALLIWVNWR